MTKKELMQSIQDIPDDYEICAHIKKYTDHSGLYGITGAFGHHSIKTIELIAEEETIELIVDEDD